VRNSKSLICAAVAITTLVGIGAASAADLPLKAAPIAPVAVYNWTGFYVGGNVGGGWGNQAVNFSGTSNILAAIAAGQLPPSLAGNPSGVIGGAQAGYNFQNGRFVYGIEADIQGANIHSGAALSTAIGGGFLPFTATADQNLSYFGTVRGRAGFTAMPALLLYGTGGFAYGGARVSSSTFATPACLGFCGSSVNSTLLTGWTAGAGAEYGFNPNWTAKLEYLYYDLGSISQAYADNQGRFALSGVTTSTAFRGNIVRVGFNYKFGTPVAAKY
jgi:outer membrane immunogenic protein